MKPLTSAETAFELLSDLGASRWLLRHHELVVEAARILCDRLQRDLGLEFDCDAVLVGAALHDVGKIVHPEETQAPGHEHEAAGRDLLTRYGVPPNVARFCVTHANWSASESAIEDLLVALADKLWKAKREEALETRLVELIATRVHREAWLIFDAFDTICETVASEGPSRLARSEG